MARLTRQVGIRSAEVRLPTRSTAGPAIIKSAQTLGDIAFRKASDQRTQEASNAAAAVNFERDGQGNLKAPSLPIAENGLIAPSIYDRKYTQMVTNRYLKQTEIDTKKQLNLLATENRFDPEAYQILAEGYVNKVTELAPEIIRNDVNMTAQVTMVEHYNRIIRETAERDHREATETQIAHIDDMKGELYGLVRNGADPEKIGAKVLQLRAAIEEGRDIKDGGLSFFNDPTMDALNDSIDKDIVMAHMLAAIQTMPDDDLAHAEARKAIDGFNRGEGTVPSVDEFGNPIEINVMDMFPNPEDRNNIAKGVLSILEQKRVAYGALQDERLIRSIDEFEDWFDTHWLDHITNGTPLDVDRLYMEFAKADFEVKEYGYDDNLRKRILGILEGSLKSNGTMSKWREDFHPVFEDWDRRYKESMARKMGGQPESAFTAEQLRQFNNDTLHEIGHITTDQTVDSAREISQYYGAMTGVDYTQKYWEDMITDPKHQGWNDLEYLIPGKLAYIGIWPKQLSDAIKGKLTAPDGMNRMTLDATLRLARMFWDQPSFKRNMQDGNALGRIGSMLDHHFRGNGILTADNIEESLENWGNSDYNPYQKFTELDKEDQTRFEDMAMGIIEDALENNWGMAHGIEGDFFERIPRQRMGGGTPWGPGQGYLRAFVLNPLKPQISGLSKIDQRGVMEKIKSYSGMIDRANLDAWTPFVARAANEYMEENGLAPTQIGFSHARMGPYYKSGLWPNQWLRGATRPIWGVSRFPPEFFARDADGNVDRELIQYITNDFQKQLDAYSAERWPDGKYKLRAGINAGLEFSGIDTAPNREDQPTYHIVLLDEDLINPEVIFQLDGANAGTPYRFTLQASKDRYNEAKRKEFENRPEGRGTVREISQEFEKIRGPIRDYEPMGMGDTFPIEGEERYDPKGQPE